MYEVRLIRQQIKGRTDEIEKKKDRGIAQLIRQFKIKKKNISRHTYEDGKGGHGDGGDGVGKRDMGMVNMRMGKGKMGMGKGKIERGNMGEGNMGN